jgi:predicted alpha/beta superfamily hydrolase
MTLTKMGAAPWVTYAAYTGEGPGHSVTGNVVVLPGVYSPQLDNQRDILVYLPPRYADGQGTYPVIYLQDGQNLFDQATAFGGKEWRVDETLETLAAAGQAAIAVGLPHMGEGRLAEYNPFAARGGRGEDYLRFLVQTVKPLIDHTFRTRPEREATGIMGSSMGGLISVYGFFRHAAVFGFAGGLSPAFWYGGQPLYNFVLRAAPVRGRLYLDRGTGERGGARRMKDLLVRRGYVLERDLRYVEEEGGQHTEEAWARRLPDALRFLLPRS